MKGDLSKHRALLLALLMVPVNACSYRDSVRSWIENEGIFLLFLTGSCASLILVLVTFFHFKRDLAERRQREAKLRLSEGRYRALYNDNPTMITTVDADLNMISVNPACASILGYTIEELEHQPVLNLFHEEDRPFLEQDLHRCFRDPDQVFFWQYRKVRKDGTVLWVEETARGLFDLEGRPNVLVVCQDVTQRRTAESQREQTLLQLEAVLESVNEAVVISDLDGNIVTMNKEALRSHGFRSVEEARGPFRQYEELFELMDLQGRPLPFNDWPLPRVLRGEVYDDYEVQVRRRDSGAQWISSVNGTPVYDKEGHAILAVVTHRNITRRKSMEEDLRLAKEQLQLIADTMPVAVVRCSRDRRFLWVSAQYAAWLRRSPDEIAGRAISEVIGDSAYQAIESFITRVLNGERVQYEVEIDYGGLGLRWISGKYSPVYNQAGELDGWVAVIIDVTDQKLMQHELQQSKELLEQRVAQRTAEVSGALSELHAETQQRLHAVEELREKEQLLIHQSRLAAMGEMIGNIAHQWRQPLNTLALLVQELSMTYKVGELTPGYMETNIRKTLDTIRHMSKTIDDFMYFFRPLKEKEEFRVLEVVRKSLSLMEGTLKTLDIEAEVTAEGDPAVTGYPNEYSQALLNMIVNARDAFAARRVPAPKLAIRVASENGRSVVTVTDNAGGIPEEIIARIFDPYFTTKGPDKGTGVGLYMAKVIIEKNMSGSLTARNVPGGAEFRIEV